jgi:hypothetical protein
LSTGWFFGLKLHLVINDTGEIIKLLIIQAHVDDREPQQNTKYHEKLSGKLFADREYISQNIFEPLINVVTSTELLTMLGSNPKGMQSVNLLHAKVTRT